MDKNTRQALNADQIKKSLMDELKISLFLTCMLEVGAILFSLILMIMFSMSEDPAFAVAIFLIVAAPMVLIVPVVINTVKVGKGRFYVVEDELVRMDEEVGYGSVGFRYRLKKVFHFMHHGRYILSKSDPQSVYEYSKIGDRFYLLFLERRKYPVKIYNKNVYDIKDDLIIKLKQDI